MIILLIKTHYFINIMNLLIKTYYFIKMSNSLNKTDGFIKMMNSLSIFQLHFGQIPTEYRTHSTFAETTSDLVPNSLSKTDGFIKNDKFT